MARTIVTYRRRDDRIPFLRGLLTQSLVDVGLSFTDAYAVASAMRDQGSRDTNLLVQLVAEFGFRHPVADKALGLTVIIICHSRTYPFEGVGRAS